MRAFSLIELSIVLVILGLLTGGILAGKSLIRASELRSVPTQATQFRAAVQSFRDKYLAIPGDMANATQFWGAVNTGGAGGNCSVPASDIGSGTQTCNGTGNGFIASTGSGGASAQTYEVYRFWQHLANAGLIEGQFTGVTGPNSANHALPGTNVPRGRFGDSGWTTSYGYTLGAGASDFVFTQTGHYFQIGKTSSTSTPNLALFAPEEAWNIDTKMDDGLPATGNVTIKYWDGCTTAVDGNDLAAQYDFAVTTTECVIKFFRQF